MSPSVVLSLATGQLVPPIHRKNLYSLQYSMLPARRAEVWEVWRRLTQPVTSTGKGAVKISNGSLKIPNGVHI